MRRGCSIPSASSGRLGAAFVGLKGIQYVAKVATYSAADSALGAAPGAGPLRRLGVQLYSPPPDAAVRAARCRRSCSWSGAIVGFFATAGAAGVDFGMNNRDEKDVQMGGMSASSPPSILTAGISVIAVAGARASGSSTPHDPSSR